jgi:hypothetical protein
MKHIWTFGEEGTVTPSTMGGDGFQVKHFTHSQLLVDMNRVEGGRPHLIVNLSKPFEELKQRQDHMKWQHDAPIINLY